MAAIRVPPLPFRQHSLGNGLQLLLHSDRRFPQVHISLYYRVGSSYEVPGRSGLAHLFEHMMFQGSARVPKNEHGRLVDEAGGRWNASTNKDRTNYYNTVPSNALELALWLEAERMSSLEVTDETFENQRQTVLEERKQSYENRPYGPSFLRFDELAYTNWAYGHSIIGDVSDLESLDLESAQAFHRTHYGPGNCVLAMAGDFDPDTGLQLVEDHFGEIEDGTESLLPDLREPAQEAERIEVVGDRLAALPAVSIGYRIGTLASDDYYIFSVLALIVAGGDSSRLCRRLIFEKNWITDLYAGPNQYRGPQVFRLWFQLQSGIDWQTVVDAIEEEFAQIGREGVSVEELEMAKNQLAHRFVGRLSTVSQVGELLNYYAVYHNDPDRLNRDLDRFLAVDSDAIREAVTRRLRRDSRTLLVTEVESQ